jgi:hypothetical protein
MKEFTGYQYLLMDIANNFNLDLDKKTFEDRIAWTEANLAQLEQLAVGQQWKEKPMYLKAVQALRLTEKGIPTGHLVGLDAVCSGMQIMSAITGCVNGATATGLVDPDRRADAYTECTSLMNIDLGTTLTILRAGVKQAVMTCLYGSKKEPKNEFGEDTPELNSFYKSLFKMAPGACDLLEDLLASWQPYAKDHAYTLPDGFEVVIKVMTQVEHRIEVDELAGASFSYTYYENRGLKSGVKNAANVIHSIDGYLLRSLIRRCSYNSIRVSEVSDLIQIELMDSAATPEKALDWLKKDNPAAYACLQDWQWSGIADPVMLQHLDPKTIKALPCDYLRQLNRVLSTMLNYKPFDIVTVHDDFRAHPNNLNQLRKHYRNILADLADSRILEGILGQLHGSTGTYDKLTPNLGNTIRHSNYAIC